MGATGLWSVGEIGVTGHDVKVGTGVINASGISRSRWDCIGCGKWFRSLIGYGFNCGDIGVGMRQRLHRQF